MSFFDLRKIVFCAVTALALTSAAQASEVSITMRADDGLPHRIVDYNDEVLEGRRYNRTEHRYEHRDPDRYYGRPVPEWRERKHPGEYRSLPVVDRHVRHRPVFARPRWGHREDCKIFIKERINRWGEEVHVRRMVCR